MQLVERHVIKRADPRFAAIDAAAFASKNLYNAANYLNYYELHQRMKGHEAYQALPAKVAQWVLRILDQNWQSFFTALAAWQEDPTAFLGRPCIPCYKHKQQGRNLLVYTIQALSLPALRAGLIVPSMLGVSVRTRQQHESIKQVRIVPRKGFYVVEVIYEQKPLQPPSTPRFMLA